MDKTQSWHLDKRVNVSIIVVLFVQIVGASYYFSQLVSRIDSVEALASNNRQTVELIRARQQNSETSLARLDERMSSALRLLEKIDKKINQ